MSIKIGLVSLGCSKNLVDSERMLYKIRERGYELVTEPGLSDIAVVNTCGFIQSAKEEAIETILELGKLKEEGTIKKIIITGCLSERYRQEAAELFPEADAVIGIGNQEDIIDVIDHVLANERVVSFEKKEKLPVTGGRIISTLSFFAYLKIAEAAITAAPIALFLKSGDVSEACLWRTLLKKPNGLLKTASQSL